MGRGQFLALPSYSQNTSGNYGGDTVLQNAGRVSELRYIEQFFWGCVVFAGAGAFVGISGQVERLVWLVADAVAIVGFARAASFYTSVVLRAWPLYLWPVMAVLSSAWSLVPGLSMYHGVQLAATLLVGSVFFVRCGLEGSLRIICGALTAAILLSLLSGGRDQFGNLEGVFGHKNQLGSAGVMLFYTAVVLFWSGWRRPVTLCVAVLALAATVLSRSGTALLSMGAVIGVLGIAAVWVMSRAFFAFCLTLGITVITCFVLAISIWDIDVISLIFGLAGKDRTLTGRTVLWEYGWLTFMDHFWLGIGYKAYMASSETSGNLVQYILQQRLPYLHNNWLEVAVAFGVPGLLLFGSVLALICGRAVKIFAQQREIILIWPLCFLAQKLLMSITENPFFYNHSLDQTLLMIVYLGTLPMLVAASKPDWGGSRAAAQQTLTMP